MATVYVEPREGETRADATERAIKKFRKKVAKEGILQEVYRRTYYKSKGQIARQKKKEAKRRAYIKKMRDEAKEREF